MTLIKICGLQDRKAVRAADDANYVGFVVGSPNSHRNISLVKFQELRGELTNAQPVIVTVNPSIKFLHSLQALEDVVIQLHGRARQFAELVPDAAIGLKLGELAQYFPSHDPYHFLSIDSTTNLGYGGTGRSWEWKPVQPSKQSSNTPLLVAGGIGFDNVVQAVGQTHADGVDVSSSMERDKKKDPQLIRDFIDLVRGLP